MENAAEALKMAAAVLIFIIAIASSFSLFGTAKHTSDSIIGMRDKQAYLEAAELDTVLYTSSETIGNASGFTTNGNRIVNISDVFSTIYRYPKEKYGVTIAYSNGNLIARYDSGTESLMAQIDNIEEASLDNYLKELKKNTENNSTNINFSSLKNLYKIDIQGGNNRIEHHGAPWYGNDIEIQKRINADISKTDYIYNNQIIYKGIGLLEKLQGKTIVEFTNEIDRSKYLEDGENETSLLQQYQMPTVEIIYIVENN